jgi:hypothetical protein
MNRLVTSAGAGLWLVAHLAFAAAPAAVVEDVHGKIAGVEFMDYVAPGRVIVLGPKDGLVLGYLRSCWREAITGGTVTVGESQSVVRAGRVERSLVACGGSRPQLGAHDATQSAATVFRSMQPRLPSAKQEVPVLHGRSPLVEIGAQRGRLVIERIDQLSERIDLDVGGKGLVHGLFFDLARVGVELTPGATYSASLGPLTVEFDVARDAQPGPTPVIGRLLRFE